MQSEIEINFACNLIKTTQFKMGCTIQQREEMEAVVKCSLFFTV